MTAAPGRHAGGPLQLALPTVMGSVLQHGGTRVLGALVTMDGRQGADLLEVGRPEVCVPVHHGFES